MFQQQPESEGVQPNHSNNRLPSNLGGSANQSELFYTPNSSPEESIHPLPSNLGGSSRQSDQLSEAQITINEIDQSSEPESAYQSDQLSEPESEPEINREVSAEHLKYYRPLYLAAQSGDWATAKSFIEHDPNALTATITAFTKKTVLHVAAYCWQWEFVLKLLDLTSSESIVMQDKRGQTVLHDVAQGGSLKTAKALVQKNDNLQQIGDKDGDPPLLYAVWSGNNSNKELVWYLSLKTRFDSPTLLPSLPGILHNLILSGYHVIHVEIRNSQPHLVMVNMEDIPECILEGFPTLQPRSFATQVLQWFKRLLWKTIAELAPSVKKVRDAKLKHEYAVELVNHVCEQLSSMSFQEIMKFLLIQNPERIMPCAVTGGIEEIVKALFLHFPDLIDVPFMHKRNILQAAIEHRQVNIVNIIKDIFPIAAKNLSGYWLESGNTTLHLAGKLAPPFKLFSVSGAALQMQRELQWFKEVEEIVYPKQWEWKNTKKETPKDVFRRAHKGLAKEGEKWMKDTANSCMLVSVLIATVLFAAAFTVPGGNKNDDKGIPIFLRTNVFIVFAISDALGLFSSLTSLIMFLAILTARYEIEDFLKSLPKKLIIGLGSLFVAIAAMIIAFGAALTIVLSERWHFVSVPITLLASFPVVIFVMLQLPLFVQIVQSTYGASMFHPWPSRKFE